LSTQILEISVDSSFSDLQHLLLNRNQEGGAQLNYPLVSGLNQTSRKHYKILKDDGFSFFDLFIVDKENIIQYYTVNNLLRGRSVNELLRILRSIQHMKKKSRLRISC
jgi:alkyl hydroperoxide reductase subunit AhpC